MTECPKCGGPVYDNRADKASGKKGKKWPDFKCKDRDCNFAKWLKPKGAASEAPSNGASASGPKWTWNTLPKLYEQCLLTTEPRVLSLADRMGIKATVEDVLKATASVFIEAARSGVAPPKVRLPEPEPEPDEEFNDESD